jgi:hypothetical protein
VEFRLRHKDGSWRHVEATRTNLLDDLAVKGVVSNSRDITERRRAEEALVERALGMKRLLERGLRCDCLRLEDCVFVCGEDSPEDHSRSEKENWGEA